MRKVVLLVSLITAACNSTTSQFQKFDKDQNGFVSQEEFSAHTPKRHSVESFMCGDKNGNGKIEESEFEIARLCAQFKADQERMELNQEYDKIIRPVKPKQP